MVEKPTFNLWHQPWISVETDDGTPTDVSLEEILLRATIYRGIFDPSPLGVVAVRRLLYAILQDILQLEDSEDLADVWEAGVFPADKIKDFGTEFGDWFDLFAEDKPFMQSGDIPIMPTKKPKPKPAGYLFEEMPAGTAVTHYNHAYDAGQRFCAKCAAKGLLAIPAFASSGGAGIKPAINGVPPIYILPGGENLFQKLTASLVAPTYQPPYQANKKNTVTPWWRRELINGETVVKKKKELWESPDYLYSLTFPARRVRLHPTRMTHACVRCGTQTRWGVKEMVYDMGESLSKELPTTWQDPFAAYRQQVGKGKGWIPIRPLEGKVAWRDFATLFIAQKTQAGDKWQYKRPTILEQLEDNDLETAFDDTLYPFRAVALRTDMKMKIWEWQVSGFDVPLAILKQNANVGEFIMRGLEIAGNSQALMRRAFEKNYDKDKFKNVRQEMITNYWDGLSTHFHTYIRDFAQIPDPKTVQEGWIDDVVAVGKQTFQQSVTAIGERGADLNRRYQSIKDCHVALNSYGKNLKENYQ